MEGKEWWLEKEMAGHNASTVGEQKEMDACSWLTFSFSFSAGPQPVEWWHTQVQRVFPPQLINHPPNRHAHVSVPKVSIHFTLARSVITESHFLSWHTYQ